MKKGQAYSLIVLVITRPLFLFVSYYITAAQTLKFGLSEKIVADQENGGTIRSFPEMWYPKRYGSKQ